MTTGEPAAGIHTPATDDDGASAMPQSRLLDMMDIAYGLRQFDLRSKPANTDAVATVFDGAVGILVNVAVNRIKRGLFRRHVERPEDLRFIPDEKPRRGWLAGLFAQDPYLRCRYDGSVADFEDNEILLWSLFAASRIALDTPGLADEARQACRTLAGDMPLREDNAIAGVTRFYTRLSDGGQPIHGLCRLVLEHAGFSFGIDDSQPSPVSVDEPALFRAYVPSLLAADTPPGGAMTHRYRIQCGAGDRQSVRLDVMHLAAIEDTASGHISTVIGTTDEPPTAADIRRIANEVAAWATQDTSKRPTAILVHPEKTSALAGPAVARVHGVVVRAVAFDLSRDPAAARRDLFRQIEPRPAA